MPLHSWCWVFWVFETTWGGDTCFSRPPQPAALLPRLLWLAIAQNLLQKDSRVCVSSRALQICLTLVEGPGFYSRNDLMRGLAVLGAGSQSRGARATSVGGWPSSHDWPSVKNGCADQLARRPPHAAQCRPGVGHLGSPTWGAGGASPARPPLWVLHPISNVCVAFPPEQQGFLATSRVSYESTQF